MSSVFQMEGARQCVPIPPCGAESHGWRTVASRSSRRSRCRDAPMNEKGAPSVCERRLEPSREIVRSKLRCHWQKLYVGPETTEVGRFFGNVGRVDKATAATNPLLHRRSWTCQHRPRPSTTTKRDGLACGGSACQSSSRIASPDPAALVTASLRTQIRRNSRLRRVSVRDDSQSCSVGCRHCRANVFTSGISRIASRSTPMRLVLERPIMHRRPEWDKLNRHWLCSNSGARPDLARISRADGCTPSRSDSNCRSAQRAATNCARDPASLNRLARLRSLRGSERTSRFGVSET